MADKIAMKYLRDCKPVVVDRADEYLKRIGIRHTGFLAARITHEETYTQVAVLLSTKETVTALSKKLKQNGWVQHADGKFRTSDICHAQIQLTPGNIKLFQRKDNEF